MQLNHDKLITNQLQFSQSAHKAETDDSIAQAIILLLLKYGCFSAEKDLVEAVRMNRPLISPDVIKSALTNLDEHIQREIKQDSGLASAWSYVQYRLAQPSNKWDKVKTKELELTISLIEVLALIYRGLMEVEHFGDDAKEANLRLKTLWNCFKLLEQKGASICNHGVRQDLVLCLDGVYPGIKIVIDVQSLILALMTEHLSEKVDSFRGTAHYWPIILAEIEITKERHELLKDALLNSKEVLFKTIQEHCVLNGVGFAPFETMTNQYLDALDDLSLDWERDKVLFALKTILEPEEVTIESQKRVKKWVKKYFTFEDETAVLRVRDYVTVKETRILFLKFAPTLRLFGEEFIMDTVLNNLKTLINQYEENCTSYKAPQLLSDEFKETISTFEKAITVFKTDVSFAWVENFFVNYLKSDQTILFSQLISEPVRAKLLVNSSFLRNTFPLTQQKIYLSPYIINRFFLHAISFEPSEWNDDFFPKFQEVLTFVQNKFTDSEQYYLAENLSRDSYPEVLINQLVYLKDLYLYSKKKDNNGSEPELIQFCIPMFHLIKNGVDLVKMISKCDQSTHLAGLHLFKENLERFIQTSEEFFSLFNALSSEAQKFLYTHFEKKIQEFIPNSEVLVTILAPMFNSSKAVLLECLQDKYAEIIHDVDTLTIIFKIFNNSRVKTIMVNSLFKAINKTVKTFDQLVTLFQHTDNSTQLTLLRLSNEKLVEFIQTPEEFSGLVKRLSQYGNGSDDAQIVLYSILEAKILDFIPNGLVLTRVLKDIPPPCRKKLISCLNGNVEKIIKDVDELLGVLNTLSAYFDAQFGVNLIVSMSKMLINKIKTPEQLLTLQKELRYSSLYSVTLYKVLDDNLIKLIPNGKILANIIKATSYSTREIVFEYLKDKYKEIIKDGHELSLILQVFLNYTAAKEHAILLDSLSDSLSQKVTTFEQLNEIVKNLAEECHLTLLTSLKYKMGELVKNAGELACLFIILAPNAKKELFNILEKEILILLPNRQVLTDILSQLRGSRRFLECLGRKIYEIIPPDELDVFLETAKCPMDLKINLAASQVLETDPQYRAEQLTTLLQRLPSNNHHFLLRKLQETLANLVETPEEFSSLFCVMSTDAQFIFWKALSKKIPQLIVNDHDLAVISTTLDCASKAKLIDFLSSTSGLQPTLQSTIQNMRVAMAHEIARETIKTAQQLQDALSKLSTPSSQLELLTILKDNLPNIILTTEGLVTILVRNTLEVQQFLHKTLAEKMLQLIPNGQVLATVLSRLGGHSKSILIDCLGEKCQDIIKSTQELVFVLQRLPIKEQENLRAFMSVKIHKLSSDEKAINLTLDYWNTLSCSGKTSQRFFKSKNDVLFNTNNELIELIYSIIKNNDTSHLPIDFEMSQILSTITSSKPDLKRVGTICRRGSYLCNLFSTKEEQLVQSKIFFDLLTPLEGDKTNGKELIKALRVFCDKLVIGCNPTA